MPIEPKQVFQCLNCGNEVIALTFHDCDCIEGSTCTKCDEGIYCWQGPVESEREAPASVLPSYDDVDTELGAAFDKLISE